MKQGDILLCRKTDERNLISIGKQYVVKHHWSSSFIDIHLPDVNSWATFDINYFYSIDEYRELKLKELGI